METVKSLRQSGYKVRVIHKREYTYTSGPFFTDKTIKKESRMNEKGGYTFVEIRTPDEKEYFGEAKCSDLDNYNKKVGVQIALGRALKKIQNDDCSV